MFQNVLRMKIKMDDKINQRQKSATKTNFLAKCYVILFMLALCVKCDPTKTGDPPDQTMKQTAQGDSMQQPPYTDSLNVIPGSKSQHVDTPTTHEVEDRQPHCEQESENAACSKTIHTKYEDDIPKDEDNQYEPYINTKEVHTEKKEQINSEIDNHLEINENRIEKMAVLDVEVQNIVKESGAAMEDKSGQSEEKDPVTPQVTATESVEEDSSDRGLNNSFIETNSTLIQWLKYVLDPLIEEFKDGIYPKASEKASNTSQLNETEEISNETLSTETVNSTGTLTETANTTEVDSANVTESGKKTKFQCVGRNVTDNINATVKLITTAKLLQMLNFDKNSTENVTDCLLVMFYAPWCHFCAKTAPHYNALARAFPQLDFVAVDTAQFSNLLARFGTVSVPNILVFHQSRAAVKFNQTDRTFEHFLTFVTNTTGLEPNTTVNVTEVDHLGPVPSTPTNDTDYLLLISWMFVIFCSSCMFVKSTKGQQWINKVRLLWQEHQHID